MWRTALIAVAVYGYGHPMLEGYRPGLLDRPMQAFHTEIKHAGYESYRVVMTLDATQAGRTLRSYVEYANNWLRGNKAPNREAAAGDS